MDIWWQRENGGFLCSTIPAVTPTKPGGAGPGMSGIHASLFVALKPGLQAVDGMAQKIWDAVSVEIIKAMVRKSSF